MVAYLKAGPQVRTYSDCLREPKKWRRKILWSFPRVQGLRQPIMPQSYELPVSFLCRNSRAASPPQKHQPCIWHTWRKKALEETRTKGMMIPMELMGLLRNLWCVLQGAVKDAQTEEKCCYHCSSLEHFIHNCPLMKTLRGKLQLNGKEGMVSKKGA